MATKIISFSGKGGVGKSTLLVLMLKYIIAREILGNLVQYNRMEHDTVPIKYNIMARNYLLLKLQGQKDTEIVENMKKLNIDIDLENIQNIMNETFGLIKKYANSEIEEIIIKIQEFNLFFYIIPETENAIVVFTSNNINHEEIRKKLGQAREKIIKIMEDEEKTLKAIS